MRKTPIFIGFLTAILALSGAQGTEAQTKSEVCDLTVPVDELRDIQSNTTMDEVAHLNAEIPARRKLLNMAIDCDQKDIATRVEVFSRLSDKMKVIPAYRGILEDLDKASKYYENQKVSIQNLGVRDLRTSSKEIAVWRKATFLPALTWADNFIIWADNQQFIEKASERLTQVSRVAFSLKLVNQDEINNLFQKAQKSFDTASSENDKAQKALNQGRANIALTNIQGSLKALAETYRTFFSLQESLKKVVE